MIKIELTTEAARTLAQLLEQMPLSGRAAELARVLTLVMDIRRQIETQLNDHGISERNESAAAPPSRI